VKIYFLVDATAEIGSGHFYRCLALAQFLREKVLDIIFIGNISNPQLVRTLKEFKYNFVPYLESSQSKSRIDTILEISQKMEHAILIIDNINVTEDEEEYFVGLFDKVISIVDRLAREHHSQILISPSFHIDSPIKLESYAGPNCKLLLGPTYLPLSPLYKRFENFQIETNEVRRVTSFFGSSDPGNQSQEIIAIAKMKKFQTIDFHIILGSANNSFDKPRIGSESTGNLKISNHCDNIAEVWSQSDIAFGSYGVSAIERCYLGIPTITSIQNLDQIDDAKFLISKNAVLDIGKTPLAFDDYYYAFEKLLHNSELRSNISANSKRTMERNRIDSEALKSLILQ
jgi:UDP-2,4-diacetamido-2,4,6-trideoxy-beta-L-altropyranose hydrolase